MTTTLRPQLDSMRRQAESVRTKAGRLKGLTPAQMTWSPGAGRWTIAQVLDHLNKTHSRVLPKFAEVLKTAPKAGGEGDETHRLRLSDRVFLKFMAGEGPFKVPVPPLFEPDRDPDPEAAVARFFELHDELARLIEESEGFRLTGLRVPSPMSDKVRPGYVVYLTGIFMHEEYHWGQIEAIIRDPAFPT